MRLWLVVALVACGRSAPENETDCALIEHDPTSAPRKLSEKYPGDPIKVSATIERCVAPAGEICERMAKIWAAIPSMMPGGTGSDTTKEPLPAARAIELCKGMPPEMQRCMLPSYVGGHTDECKTMLDTMAITSIEVTPRGKDSSPPPQEPSCDELTIEIGKDGIRYGRATPETVGPADWVGLETGLKKLAEICVGPGTMNTAPNARYQDMITVMDIALKVGFRDIRVDAGEPPPAPPRSTSPTPRDPGKPGRTALQTAPVIVVTRTDVMLDGKTLVAVDQDATEPVRTALAARKVDPNDETRVAILQAEPATPARTINQVIVGAQRAGYGNVSFAVKHK